jgi:hypothetical protein
MRFLQGWRHKELGIALIFAFISITLWRMPGLWGVTYPFQIFGTFVHEICHGIAAILTGGEFRRFAINPNLSGIAWHVGGIRWIVASAGYVGSAVFGGFLIIISAWGAPARQILFWLGVTLGVFCLLFVRNLFGIFSGLLLTAALISAGVWLNAFWANALLLFLAIQTAFDALDGVLDLITISTYRAHIFTDARTMQRLTMIPAIMWALLWAAVAAIILITSLVIAYRKPSQSSIR